MILILLLNLGCAAHAQPPADPHVLLRAQAGNVHMHELELHLLSLSPQDLALARQGARELTSTCPYNGATLQFMGTLIAQVPHDSATRPGVDSMARILALLELEPGAHSVQDSDARMRALPDAVDALTDDERARIDAANALLLSFTPDGVWPPNATFQEWGDQFDVEGHHALSTLVEVQLGNTC